MKFFIDTGNLDDIKRLTALGIIDGVTTNPSLMAKEKGDFAESIREICRVVQGPVSAEVLSIDADEMIAEGTRLAAIDPHVVVKVPFTPAGVRACKALSTAGHRVNVTLVFSPTQALIAAKVGAAFVSPFIGRLDDIATDGMALVRQIVEIYRNYDFRTEILVASVRHPMHIVEAARLGADVCTCPPAVLDACFKHPLTDLGLEKFLSDWKKSKG
jgi:transaldolase